MVYSYITSCVASVIMDGLTNQNNMDEIAPNSTSTARIIETSTFCSLQCVTKRRADVNGFMFEYCRQIQLWNKFMTSCDDVLSAWCQSNKLVKCILKKCAVISFSRAHNQASTNYFQSGTRIHRKLMVSWYLGVFIDNKLSFIKHVDKFTLHIRSLDSKQDVAKTLKILIYC